MIYHDLEIQNFEDICELCQAKSRFHSNFPIVNYFVFFLQATWKSCIWENGVPYVMTNGTNAMAMLYVDNSASMARPGSRTIRILDKRPVIIRSRFYDDY